MMYPTAVRWFLAEFLYVGIFYTNVAPAQTDCSSIIIREGEEHTIECNITNCTTPVSRDNVVWCLNYCGINVGCDLSRSLCINSTGTTNTVGGETPTSISSNIEVTNSGGLHNARVTFELRNTTYNCSVVDSEGNVCGPQRFAFRFRVSTRPIARIESTSPSSNVLGEVQVPNTHVGATRTLCVQGESPLTDTSWMKADLRIPAVNVPHTGCFTCGCLVDKNLNLSLGASPNEPRYSAFQAFGADCSGVVDFVSLLVIKNATLGDGGNYVFIIKPGVFPTTATFVVQEPEYLSLPPVFHNPGAERTIVLNESSNERFLCNATTSGNANLEWKWRRNGATLPIPISNCSSSSIISGASLSDICEQCSPACMFSIPVGHTEIHYYTTDNEATVVLQQLELILCDVQANISGAYSCIASDSSQESARLEIESSPTESSPTPGNGNTTNAVPLIVVLMAALTMLLLECDTVTELLSQLSDSG